MDIRYKEYEITGAERLLGHVLESIFSLGEPLAWLLVFSSDMRTLLQMILKQRQINRWAWPKLTNFERFR